MQMRNLFAVFVIMAKLCVSTTAWSAEADEGNYALPAVAMHPEAGVGVLGSPLGASCGSTCTTGVLSFWFRGSYGIQSDMNSDASWGIGGRDILSNASSVGGSSEHVQGLDIVADNASGCPFCLRLNLNDSTTGSGHNVLLAVSGWHNSTWHHYLAAWNTGLPRPVSSIWIDGVYAKSAFGSAPFYLDLNNPAGWGINLTGANNYSAAFEVAQVFLDTKPNTNGLLNASGQWISSKYPISGFVNTAGPVPTPVSFGSECATPTGEQPDVCLAGDKSSFAINQGSATGRLHVVYPSGALQTHGAIVASPQIYDAAVGPGGSQVQRPYLAWVASNTFNWSGVPASANSFSALPVTNRYNAIAVGDLLILAVQLTEHRVFFDRGISTPSGWTSVEGSPVSNNGAGGFPTNAALFYKVATADDVTREGSLWPGPVVTWTGNENAPRSASWELFDYKGASPTTPMQASSMSGSVAAAATMIAPSVTPKSPSSTLLTWFWVYDTVHAGQVATAKFEQNLRFKRSGGARQNTWPWSVGYAMLSDEPLRGTMPTGTRSATQQYPAPYVSASMVIGP